MKTLLTSLVCAFGMMALASSADAAYWRTIMGHDSRGNPIYRVTWVADYLVYAQLNDGRRTYRTSVRRDPASTPTYTRPTYSA